MRNPQLNKHGELQHLLTLDGLPRSIITQILDTAAPFTEMAERAHDHGQRGGNGVLRGVGVGAQLLRNLAGGRALQLAKQIVDERAVHAGVLA